MTVTKRCIMIPVDELQPHPDNPRKDIGDVTELAESIKANGIFQNLTVLRNRDPETGKSTVIIGHRRLAAAKLAGLKEAGTNNFRYAVEKAVAEENRRVIAHAWKKLFGSLGEEIPYSEKTKKRQISSYYMSRSPEEQKESISKLAADNAPVYWCVDQYNYIYLLGEPKADAPSADEVKEKYRLEQQVKAAKLERIREVENRAIKLRLDFVKGYSRHNGMTALLIELIREEPEICDVNWSFAAELCGVKLAPEKDEDGDEDVTADVFAENSDIIYALVNSPAKVLLAMLAAYLEENLFHTMSVHDGIGEHRQNEHLDRWYATLQKLGYSISDDEKAMLDGTHECFMTEDN